MRWSSLTTNNTYTRNERESTLYLPLLINERVRTWLIGLMMLANIAVLLAAFGLVDILLYRAFEGDLNIQATTESTFQSLVNTLPYLVSMFIFLLFIFNWATFYLRSHLKTSPGRIDLIQNDIILYHQYYGCLLVFLTLPFLMGYLMVVQHSAYGKLDGALKSQLALYYNDSKVKQAFDQMQIDFECCGKTDPYLDWVITPEGNSKTSLVNEYCTSAEAKESCLLIPFSCCDSSTNFTCNAILPNKNEKEKNGIYNIGCTYVLRNEFNLSLFHLLVLLSIIQGCLICVLIIDQFVRTSIHSAIVNDHPRMTSYGWLWGKNIDDIDQQDLLTYNQFRWKISVKLKAPSFGFQSSTAASLGLQKTLSGVNTTKVKANARYILFDGNAITTLNRERQYRLLPHNESGPRVIVSKTEDHEKKTKVKKKGKKKRNK